MNLVVKRNGSMFPTLLSDVMDVDDFFNTNLIDLENKFFSNTVLSRVPSANVTEREKDFLVEMAVPGMEKKDFTIELDGDYLTVSAEKEETKEDATNGSSRREFSYNSFTRSFRLPDNHKEDKIKAEYANGILKIEIPKKEVTVTKPTKKIAVS